ncbi:hypothetical protein DH2020_009927 [Rehmannia glutinosa]|uniref:mitogen-activated protein kinase kinase kinase n=1 Tax=Rehmannia glutinosa TaxID=99300 RepID=A0ABR0X8B1_REHGL
MSRIYDNWEKLVAAVLKKEQLWQLFHEQSRSPSISSESSGFSFSFNLTSSLDDVPFSFSSPDWSASNQKEDDIAIKTAVATPSSFVKDQSPVENLSPNKNVTITPPRKRNLRIQVPKPQLQQNGASCWPNVSPRMTSPAQSSRVHTRTGGGHSVSLTNWPDDAKHQTHPLPLPPEAFLNSLPNSAATSPTASLLSPERAENLKSPVTQWKRGRLIGRGAFGNVYVGFHSEKGEMCAMKEVKLSSDDANSKQGARMFEIEVTILSSLKHPNVVQYYGSETIAAMFKIGNSKERPAIPDHLSDEGKDFVMLCLQRNPLHRPTAAQLLEHPFVKSIYLRHPKPTRVSSTSSTPLIGGNVAIRYPHLNQSILPQESFRILPKHLPGISSPSYWDPNILQGASSDNHSHRKQFGRFANGQVNEQSALADRVFQQLLKAPVKLNPPSLDWNPSSPLTSHRVAGI